MAKRKKGYDSKALTNHLRQLASEAHDWTEADGVITKGEALARLLFKKALGSVEEKIDDEGNRTEIFQKPEAWAIQLIYDRLEGKTPQAVQENEQRIKAADQVRELAKDRINALVTVKSGPPKHKPRK